MGVALFPVLETEIEGLDISFDGKMLARLGDKDIEKRASLLGFEPLMSFFGIDPELLDEFDLEADTETTGKWFSADEGLKTAESLAADLAKNPHQYAATEGERLGAIEDLRRLGEILNEARKYQIRWYLAIDF